MAWNAVTFNQNGGSGGETRTLYAYYSKQYGMYNISYFATAQSASTAYRISSVNTPTKNGFVFAGYYNSAGVLWAYSSGSLVSGYFDSLPGNLTARWQSWQTVTIDKNGGTGGTETFYREILTGKCYSSSSLSPTTEIFGITIPSKFGYKFLGAKYNGQTIIDENGNFTSAFRSMSISSASFSATSEWTPKLTSYGDVLDYFNFSSDALIPIESDNGDNKKRVCVTNANWNGMTQTDGAGKYSSGVNETGGIWRNPTVTYVVVKDTTLDVTLGKAFPKTGTTISGYMITSVAVHTAVGQFPRVTISATANEGADAINTFRVQVSIAARSKAQNLQSAISGGGHLQELTLAATAEPVVCEENLMPSASDIVNGRIEVNALTVSAANQSAPTAGTGFTSVGEPQKTTESSYLSYQITVQKELT